MDWNTLKANAAPVVVTVNVELPYGRELAVPLATLSYGRWMQAETMVPEPAVPRTLAGPGGTKVQNPQDVKYRQELAEANEKRAYIRLAMALEDGGMSITGSTIEEKAMAVRNELDAGVANALLVFLAQAAMQGKAQATSAADGFR